MNDVVELDAHRTHETKMMQCAGCGIKWQAVFPAGCDPKECPACGHMNEVTIMEKSEQSRQMERSLLAAVIHMGCESLSPDAFDALADAAKQLADTRNLGDAPLVDYV